MFLSESRRQIPSVFLSYVLVLLMNATHSVAQVVSCSDSTVAFWSFDDDFTDACGGVDGVPVGTAEIAVSGCAPISGNSGCLSLSGGPSRVDLSAPFNPTYTSTLSAGTIEAWVYFDGNYEGHGTIFNHGTAFTYTDLNVGVAAFDGEYSSQISVPFQTYPLFPVPQFAADRWHHFAWTWDDLCIKTYLDGQLVVVENRGISIPFDGNEAEIGSDDQEVSYWVGKIDALRLSNEVLEPNQFLVGQTVPLASGQTVLVMAALLVISAVMVIRNKQAQGSRELVLHSSY